MDNHYNPWDNGSRGHGAAAGGYDALISQFDTETVSDRHNPQRARPAGIDGIAGAVAAATPQVTFAALLRSLRCEAGLTLDQVASAVGVAKPSVWAWESGRAKPTREKWQTLAKTLGIDPQMLASAVKTEAMNKAASLVLRVEEVDRAGVLAAGREMIAKAYGVTPSAVRIVVEI